MTERAPRPPLMMLYLVVATVMTGLFIGAPSMREGMLVEDGPLESATAIAFLVAAVLAARHLRSSTAVRSDVWIVTVFAALAFLDEISFGARIIGYTPPEVDGITVDSLHDVFDLIERLAEHLGVGRTGLAAGAFLVLLMVTAWLWRSGRSPAVISWLRRHPAVTWCCVSVGLLLGAVALDLVGTNEMMRLGEELLELAAATLTVRAALALDDESVVDEVHEMAEATP